MFPQIPCSFVLRPKVVVFSPLFSCISCSSISYSKMGDGKIEMFKDEWFRCGSNVKKKDDSSWMINNSPSIGESTISTCSSLETTDDASSLSSSAGAFSDLSTLMLQLPIKRGLSEYYEGKSESFTCLGSVEEDLRKKGTPYSRKMKACKSSYTLTKPIIFKKVSRSSILSSSYTSRKGKFFYQQEQEQAFQY